MYICEYFGKDKIIKLTNKEYQSLINRFNPDKFKTYFVERFGSDRIMVLRNNTCCILCKKYFGKYNMHFTCNKCILPTFRPGPAQLQCVDIFKIITKDEFKFTLGIKNIEFKFFENSKVSVSNANLKIEKMKKIYEFLLNEFRKE